MRKLWLTLAGGFCGAITRYLLSAPLRALLGSTLGMRDSFPLDVLLINLSGALLIGLLYGLIEHGAPISPDTRHALGAGFLGAYTTFSSYLVGADFLLTHGRVLVGAFYLLGSAAGGIILAFAGHLLADAIWNRLLAGAARPPTSSDGPALERTRVPADAALPVGVTVTHGQFEERGEL